MTVYLPVMTVYLPVMTVYLPVMMACLPVMTLFTCNDCLFTVFLLIDAPGANAFLK